MTKSRKYFQCQLLTDIVVSATSSSAGGNETLRHIPGLNFLGACAGKLYKELASQDLSFSVFHDGAVRFGNAYPLDTQGNAAIPLPLSWHYLKGEEYRSDNRYCGEKLHNLVRKDEAQLHKWGNEGIQPKQLREGFFSETGEAVLPDINYRMKTAIDRTALGRSSDEKLFGYESIAEGSAFHFSLTFDEALDKETVGRIVKVLTSGEIRVGRSRTAEYGRVRITPLDNFSPWFEEGQSALENRDEVVLYCLSDLALRSENGMPTLEPNPRHFGLPDGFVFSSEKSHLRSRSYTPFNGTWKRFEVERQVIRQGSVLIFRRKGIPLNNEEAKALESTLENGVGFHLQEGLGHVIANPAFLEKENPTFMKAITAETNKTSAPTKTLSSGLISWLGKQVSAEQENKDVFKLVMKWSEVFANACAENSGKSPGKTQWSRLREIATESRNAAELEDGLGVKDIPKKKEDEQAPKETVKEGLCNHGVSARKWQVEFYLQEQGKRITYRDGLGLVLKETKPKGFGFQQKVFYFLGRQIPHEIERIKQRNKDGKGGNS